MAVRQRFATTRWSLILRATRSPEPEAGAALEELCHRYWYPLYAFARSSGKDHDEAEDLTQGFFVRLLEKNWLVDADREKGHFRNFLLVAFKHYMAKEKRHQHTLKRRPKAGLISWDQSGAKLRYGQEPEDADSPERIFERNWARATLDAAIDRLEKEYEQRGEQALFACLKEFVIGSKSPRYREIARQLNLGEPVVRYSLRKLRERFRDRLRRDVAQTVERPEQVKVEMKFLLESLTR